KEEEELVAAGGVPPVVRSIAEIKERHRTADAESPCSIVELAPRDRVVTGFLAHEARLAPNVIDRSRVIVVTAAGNGVYASPYEVALADVVRSDIDLKLFDRVERDRRDTG